MKSMTEIAEINTQEEQQISEAAIYDDAIARLQKYKEEGIPVDEGLLGAIVGGIAGATMGPKVMKTICNCLGIDEKGALGSLMTSRMIITLVCGKLGWKM